MKIMTPHLCFVIYNTWLLLKIDTNIYKNVEKNLQIPKKEICFQLLSYIVRSIILVVLKNKKKYNFRNRQLRLI